MTIENKLAYLEGTKAVIKSAIEDKGVVVPEETTFREYADKISQISGGGGGGNELFFYRVRLIRPSGATARFAIRKMEAEDRPGGVSVLDDQRGLLTLPFTIADPEAVAPQYIGSDRAFGREFGVSNVVDTGDNFFSSPADTSSGLLDVSIYIMSTDDVDINVVTVQTYTITSTRVGPDTIEVTKLNPITNQWEDAWEVTQPGIWTSNEERVYYRPGYTPPGP